MFPDDLDWKRREEQTNLEGLGGNGRRLDRLAVDYGHKCSIHGLPKSRVEAVVRAAQWRVADGVPGAAHKITFYISIQPANEQDER